jgi:PLD-like domain
MSTELVTGKVWSRLGDIHKNTPRQAWVAIAYFGKGAANLLPLKEGSQLVVNASDETVEAGQTCPADLIKLQRKGVRIFNYTRLHAKVYVFGTVAAIGSANASRNSANVLTEAMVLTTDRQIVNDAKEFVRSVAKNEMGPDELRRLQKLYREPRRPFAGEQRKPPLAKSALPNIRVVNFGCRSRLVGQGLARAAGWRGNR